MPTMRTIIIIGPIALVVIAGYSFYVSRPLDRMEFSIFDTKGAPSVFIRTPTDVRILVDGGANSEVIRRITKRIPFYSRRIDTIIVTKADADHVSGLIDVIGRYRVGSVIVPAVDPIIADAASSTDVAYRIFINAVTEAGISISYAKRGDTIDLGGRGSKDPLSLKAEVLFPEADLMKFHYSKASAPELVMKIQYGKTSILLLGNATTKIQRYIAEHVTEDMIDSNALVVSHGLDKDLFAEQFIEKVRPASVVYSASAFRQSEKRVPDAFPFILKGHRFNLKQKNALRALSDGDSIEFVDGEGTI